jgi:peptidyl-prolyl cis-trans isomerase C
MVRQSCSLLAVAALSLTTLPAFAQTTPPAPPAASPANGIAATVNGTPVYEVAVQRGLKRVPPDKRKIARTEILNFLVDNVLIEQYLQQLQVTVDPKDVDTKLEAVRAEIKKTGKEWENWLQVMQLTEAELKLQITADQRWNKYALGVATDKVLRDYFEANKDMFDGTQVHARHIFLSPPATDPKACEEAVKSLRAFKQEIEQKVAAALQKLPAETTALERETARRQLLEDEFAAIAKEKSLCPSKTEGGDLHYFPRVSDMVEPFSKAAFALKPYEMSDVVQTPFGLHLILVTDRTGTRDVKFEDEAVKNAVLEAYCEKLREAMVTQARQKSRIEITPVAKP